MTQEEKKLLLIDLCAREPYHPRIQVFNDDYEGFQVGEFDTNLWFHHVEAFLCDRIEILPYLRPMGSMTEEERKEYKSFIFTQHHEWDGHSTHTDYVEIDDVERYVTWLNKKGFDYRGLIPMGLALEEKNIK